MFKNHKNEGKLAQLLYFYSAVHKKDCAKFSWLRFAHEVFAENKITLKYTTTFHEFIIVPQSVLRRVQSLCQIQFFIQFDLVFPLSISHILSLI